MICNARIGLKIIVRHYKTIKFYIKTLLNIQNFMLQLCARSVPKILKFFLLLPPPPNPKNGSTPLLNATCHIIECDHDNGCIHYVWPCCSSMVHGLTAMSHTYKSRDVHTVDCNANCPSTKYWLDWQINDNGKPNYSKIMYVVLCL